MQKSLKFSDYHKSIRKQIRPSCRETFRPHFVLVWFRESKEIYRFARIFAVRSKCFGKELPPLSNCIQTKKQISLNARKSLGTSLALQCYTGFVSSGFPSKIAYDKIDEKRRQSQTVHPFCSIIYSLFLSTQQDCVLPVMRHFVHCTHTPGNVGVSSKHVLIFSNYSNSMWLAITTTVESACSPAVRGGTVTQLPNVYSRHIM